MTVGGTLVVLFVMTILFFEQGRRRRCWASYRSTATAEAWQPGTGAAAWASGVWASGVRRCCPTCATTGAARTGILVVFGEIGWCTGFSQQPPPFQLLLVLTWRLCRTRTRIGVKWRCRWTIGKGRQLTQ